jgi:hypothetical protein
VARLARSTLTVRDAREAVARAHENGRASLQQLAPSDDMLARPARGTACPTHLTPLQVARSRPCARMLTDRHGSFTSTPRSSPTAKPDGAGSSRPVNGPEALPALHPS